MKTCHSLFFLKRCLRIWLLLTKLKHLFLDKPHSSVFAHISCKHSPCYLGPTGSRGCDLVLCVGRSFLIFLQAPCNEVKLLSLWNTARLRCFVTTFLIPSSDSSIPLVCIAVIICIWWLLDCLLCSATAKFLGSRCCNLGVFIVKVCVFSS